jgi:integrase
MSRRNANGEGSIWHRKVGRWCGGAYVRTVGTVLNTATSMPHPHGGRRQALDLQKRHNDGYAAGSTTLTVEQFVGERLSHMSHRVRRQAHAGDEINVGLHLVPRIGSRSSTG